MPLSPESGSQTRAAHVLVDQESHPCVGPIETSGAESGRLVVTLLLNERPILGHIVESLEDRLQRDLILPGEFFGQCTDQDRGWPRRPPPLGSVDP